MLQLNKKILLHLAILNVRLAQNSKLKRIIYNKILIPFISLQSSIVVGLNFLLRIDSARSKKFTLPNGDFIAIPTVLIEDIKISSALHIA